jgi:hypothetical protein
VQPSGREKSLIHFRDSFRSRFFLFFKKYYLDKLVCLPIENKNHRSMRLKLASLLGALTLISFYLLLTRISQDSEVVVGSTAVAGPHRRVHSAASLALLPTDGLAGVFCAHTTESMRGYAVDSTGAVCFHYALDPTGCCPATTDTGPWCPGPVHCPASATTTQCCDEYEPCVVCCLEAATRTLHSPTLHSPPHMDSDRPAVHPRGSSSPSPRRRRNVEAFEACTATCRTSSKSLLHGNEFLSPFVHCFG